MDSSRKIVIIEVITDILALIVLGFVYLKDVSENKAYPIITAIFIIGGVHIFFRIFGHLVKASVPPPFTKEDSKEFREDIVRVIKKDKSSKKESKPATTIDIPYHSLGKFFIGRNKKLEELHSIIIDEQTSIITGVGVVSGTGGIGKTQLAIEYAHRFKTFFQGGIFWVHAESGRQKMIDEIAVSAGFAIDGTEPEEKQMTSLWNYFSNMENVLIILDNFSETDILSPWLPPSSLNIHTLVTTRRKDLTKYASIELDFLEKKDGIKLLNSGKREIGKEAGELVELLGGLPLALELVRHYLNIRNDISIPRLIEDITQTSEVTALTSFSETYKQELPSGHSKEIVATFQLSWDLVSEKGKKILKILSLLAPAPVPIKIIRKILDQEETIGFQDPLLKTIHEELFSKLSIIELGWQNGCSLKI